MIRIFRSSYRSGLVRFTKTSLLAVVIAMLATACGGTKVYTADKTVVYNDAIYNVSNVQVLTRKTEGVVTDNEVLDLSDTEKRAFNDLLEQHGGEVFVRQVFMLDEQELVYRAQNVDSWSDFNRMVKKFDDAGKDMQKFLGDGKDTQLKLK